ncbi:sugar transferase [Streptomyces virginiae]|uniref:sugar transferase n=1 Tax=Streptomyces TaxID=1883 RepID=UPI00136C0A6B|nr:MULTISPECIES: sugar transferase [Streptomyces]MCX4716086.1 sugar transferase [Streptomyces virginiae]MCX5273855.1 sugar transferase [Streptomyces virginiae]MYV74840.1 exopolysaccharide biosynthesis polyprenyl glycosylphosphotransferase [Streptomyces sp. SID1046]WSC79918.1 sugar transferase [Streptomyces virginiae]
MRHVHIPAQRVARAARESLAPARRLGDKARWYRPAAIAADLLGAAIPVGLVFDAAQQVRPVYCALAAAVAWTGVQALRRRYATRTLGESRGVLPVVHDWLILIGVLAVARVVTEEATPRLSALGALLPALLITIAVHKLTYRHLSAARREAQAVSRVLVVGEPDAAEDVIAHLAARTDHPYVVVGVVPVGAGPLASGVPVAARLDGTAPEAPNGDSAAVLGAVASHHADLVLVAPGVRITGERLRRIAWALHDTGLELAVFPGLVEVSVKRLETLSAGGLAVLRVAPPVSRGVQTLLKSALDRVGAAAGLLLLSPVLLGIVLAIRLGSRGPAFYRQRRIGRDGVPFVMWKFRTMVVDADALKAELSGANENDGLMFKMRRDPRVTRVGRLLRRTSLDELPQLVNVLIGNMSLVGPRPPLPEEVAKYDEVELRRLTVRPGMTGLWQISGRSDLSWDETIQLDLQYVDNWSFTSDVDVMGRTLRAVVDGRGAY